MLSESPSGPVFQNMLKARGAEPDSCGHVGDCEGFSGRVVHDLQCDIDTFIHKLTNYLSEEIRQNWTTNGHPIGPVTSELLRVLLP